MPNCRDAKSNNRYRGAKHIFRPCTLLSPKEFGDARLLLSPAHTVRLPDDVCRLAGLP